MLHVERGAGTHEQDREMDTLVHSLKIISVRADPRTLKLLEKRYNQLLLDIDIDMMAVAKTSEQQRHSST